MKLSLGGPLSHPPVCQEQVVLNRKPRYWYAYALRRTSSNFSWHALYQLETTVNLIIELPDNHFLRYVAIPLVNDPFLQLRGFRSAIPSLKPSSSRGPSNDVMASEQLPLFHLIQTLQHVHPPLFLLRNPRVPYLIHGHNLNLREPCIS